MPKKLIRMSGLVEKFKEVAQKHKFSLLPVIN
jgi:hypothetical protein